MQAGEQTKYSAVQEHHSKATNQISNSGSDGAKHGKLHLDDEEKMSKLDLAQFVWLAFFFFPSSYYPALTSAAAIFSEPVSKHWE